MVPARAHFCWIGAKLPWAYAFALLSAAARGKMDAVVLHHTDPLAEGPVTRALSRAGVRLSRLEPFSYLAQAAEPLGVDGAGGALAKIYGRVASPAIRSDILRGAILFREGGVYLDLDTVTVASLRPLLDTGQFLGREYIVWPQAVRRSRSALVWGRHLALDAARKTLRAVPDGWRAYRRIERL